MQKIKLILNGMTQNVDRDLNNFHSSIVLNDKLAWIVIECCCTTCYTEINENCSIFWISISLHATYFN